MNYFYRNNKINQIIDCTMYIVQCTLYIVQCTLYIVHCTMYNQVRQCHVIEAFLC